MVEIKYKISSVGYNFGDGCDAPAIVLGLARFEKEGVDKYVRVDGVFLYLTKSEFAEFTNKKYSWDGTLQGAQDLRKELEGKTGRMKLTMG